METHTKSYAISLIKTAILNDWQEYKCIPNQQVMSVINSCHGLTFSKKLLSLKAGKNKWSDVIDCFMIYCGGYQ